MSAPALLVVGATGPTGREVLREAARRGVPVRSLARTPAALGDVPEAGDVVRGDVLDVGSLTRAMQGLAEGGAVISALGSKPSLGRDTLLSTGTANLVAAAREAGVRRLVVVTGMGAGDSRGHGGFLYDRLILPLLLRQVYADKDRQEAVLRAADLDWTIVRPAFLTNGERTASYRALTDLPPGTRLTKISRADVAHYLLDAAVGGRDVRQVVNLST